jgi:hypothetical protein
MAPAVVRHPGARPIRGKLMDEYRISPAGDPFYAAASDQDPHACYDGVVYIGYLVEQDGEEVEVVDAVACRRCAGEAR